MQRDDRLRRRADFNAVARDGVRVSSGPLVLQARSRGPEQRDAPCRFGYAISSRVGGAVVRNRIRRRLRESARALNRSGQCEGMDVVVIARRSAAESDFSQLDRALRRLVRRSAKQLGMSS